VDTFLSSVALFLSGLSQQSKGQTEVVLMLPRAGIILHTGQHTAEQIDSFEVKRDGLNCVQDMIGVSHG
jgi:hypothetical protein